jgi:hypothetical protein
MLTSKTTETGFGELDSQERVWQRARLREAFLNAIAEHSREVFEDLANSVLTGFLKLGEFERMMTWSEVQSQSSTDAGIKLVCESVNSWAERWDLNWCREQCYNELMMDYHRASNPDRKPAPFDESILDSIFASQRWELSVPSSPEGYRHYRPTDETQADYLRYVEANSLKAFTDDPRLKQVEPSQRVASIASIVGKAKEYCAQVEQCYLNAEYVRSERKRKLALHLKWLVQVVIKRQTLSEIAESAWSELTESANIEVSVPAVSKAINQLLRQMDLPKPPHLKKGRIHGSKNKSTKVQRDLGR